MGEKPTNIMVGELWKQWEKWKPLIDSGEVVIGELHEIHTLEPRGSSDFLFYANETELLKAHWDLEIIWRKQQEPDHK